LLLELRHFQPDALPVVTLLVDVKVEVFQGSPDASKQFATGDVTGVEQIAAIQWMIREMRSGPLLMKENNRATRRRFARHSVFTRMMAEIDINRALSQCGANFGTAHILE